MSNRKILLGGNTPAILYASQILAGSGYSVSQEAGMNIRFVLLDIPSFYTDGNLRSGKNLDTMLAAIPKDAVICGGNLNNEKLDTYCTIDFLKDEQYLCANAAITADCAIQVAVQHLTTTIQDAPALIIGWGRIGKCLAQVLKSLGCKVTVAARKEQDRAMLFFPGGYSYFTTQGLKSLGCKVTVAARKEQDRAMLQALGYSSIPIPSAPDILSNFRLIYNTVPEEILDVRSCKKCVKIDLASKRGLIGDDVIWARGLPGMYAPETSGKLIAATFLRSIKEAEK